MWTEYLLHSKGYRYFNYIYWVYEVNCLFFILSTPLNELSALLITYLEIWYVWYEWIMVYTVTLFCANDDVDWTSKS